MNLEDSSPEDIPISTKPLDELFSKRLRAKKLRQEKKILKVEHNKVSSKKLKPLPQDVIESLSQNIPKVKVSRTSSPLNKTLKKAQVKKKSKQQNNQNNGVTSFQENTKKLPDFIPLENVPKKCSTKFKVGIIDAIVKNPANRNYKEHTLFHSARAKQVRRTNVKTDFVKKTLMKRVSRL